MQPMDRMLAFAAIEAASNASRRKDRRERDEAEIERQYRMQQDIMKLQAERIDKDEAILREW